MKRTAEDSKLMLVNDDQLMAMSTIPEYTILQIEPNGSYAYMIEVVKEKNDKA